MLTKYGLLKMVHAAKGCLPPDIMCLMQLICEDLRAEFLKIDNHLLVFKYKSERERESWKKFCGEIL